MNIILASASPRRKELLTQIGLEFTIIPAQGEEISTKEIPSEIVIELAHQKAAEIYQKTIEAAQLEANFLIIGADTIVVYQGKILGKPKHESDASAMLTMLSGNTHEVYTGVSLLLYENGKERHHSFYEKTAVTMYPIKEHEIHGYIQTGEPMDKAGSYGIQGIGAKFVQKIDGDYNNVVGLPVARIYQELMQMGIAIFRNS